VARTFLYIVAGLTVAVLAVLLALRIWADDLSAIAFVPTSQFTAPPPLASDAYSDNAFWLARPGLGNSDHARFLPAGIEPEETSLGAAVFFIHPTSLLDKSRWNAATIADKETEHLTAQYIRDMASPFNHSADLWAPRYRQATLGAFLTDQSEGNQAIDAAYRDILQAFEFFVQTVDQNRPIVIAGHSQGAVHARRLIAERISGTSLASRIAAAYVIGWPLSLEHDLPHLGLPACTGPAQPGCVASWQSFAEPAETAAVAGGAKLRGWLDGTNGDGRPFLCSNPLAGMANAARPATANSGSLVFDKDNPDGKLVRASIPARCDAEGFLLLGDPPQVGPQVLPGNNYHIYDIPIFWANLRRDVSERVEAWQASR